jgi:glycosyltransferase involved in cell wall biosynthesis
MYSIIGAPVVNQLKRTGHAKSYRLISHIPNKKFRLNILVGRNEVCIDDENLEITELDSRSTLQYNKDALLTAKKLMTGEKYDIYQHFNLGYNWFNPLILLQDIEIPTIVGPLQSGHSIYFREFEGFMNQIVGLNIPKPINMASFKLYHSLDDILLTPIKSYLYNKTLEQADKIIVVHEELKKDLSKDHPKSKIEVIPLGVDLDYFDFVKRKQTNELISVGALRERKGFKYLIRAMDQVVEMNNNVVLNIFGEGPRRQYLEKKISELGLDKNVVLHGRVTQDKLKQYLRSAVCFIHPTLSEGYPHVRLEAMASGCPVIGTNVTGAEEMITHNENGYIVNKANSDQIARHIQKLLNNFGTVEKFSKKGREYVENNHDYDQIGQQYRKVYNELVEK